VQLLLFIAFVGLVFAVRAVLFPKDAVDIDFTSYWAAARTAWMDEVSPYGTEAPRLAQQRWLPGLKEPVPPFIYTPAALLVFGALQWLEPLTASRLMMGLSLLAFAVMMTFLVRTLGLGDTRRAAWASGLYTLLFVPLYESIGLGQVNLLLALLLLGMWHVYRSGRATAAGGAAAALVVFLKLHLGVLLLPVLLRRRMSLLLACAVSLVVGVGLSAALLPSSVWGDWLQHVVRGSSIVQLPRGVPPMSVTRNLSIAGMTARFFIPSGYSPILDVPPWLASAVPALLCCLVLTWTLVVLWRSSRMPHTPERADAEICLTLAAAFELSPLSWGHHLVFMLPVLLLLLRRVILEPGAAPLLRGVLAVALFLLLLHPYLLGPMDIPVAVTVATLRSLSALAVWGAASLWVLRLAQARSPDPREFRAPEGLVSEPPSP
jgi:alpha-1,2-mannosyltransferase